MTEAEWRAGRDPDRLFDHLDAGGAISERKLRLFAVACCRRVAHLCPEPAVSATILDSTELFADGLVPAQELIDAYGVWGVVEQRFAGDDSVEAPPSGIRFHALQAVGQAVSLDETDCPYRNRMRDVVLHVADAVAFTAIGTDELDGSGAKWGGAEKVERAALAVLARGFWQPVPSGRVPPFLAYDGRQVARARRLSGEGVRPSADPRRRNSGRRLRP